MSPATLAEIGDVLSDGAQRLSERLAKRPAIDSPLIAKISRLDRLASEAYSESHARELLLRETTPPAPSGPISPAVIRRWTHANTRGQR